MLIIKLNYKIKNSVATHQKYRDVILCSWSRRN